MPTEPYTFVYTPESIEKEKVQRLLPAPRHANTYEFESLWDNFQAGVITHTEYKKTYEQMMNDIRDSLYDGVAPEVEYDWTKERRKPKITLLSEVLRDEEAQADSHEVGAKIIYDGRDEIISKSLDKIIEEIAAKKQAQKQKEARQMVGEEPGLKWNKPTESGRFKAGEDYVTQEPKQIALPEVDPFDPFTEAGILDPEMRVTYKKMDEELKDSLDSFQQELSPLDTWLYRGVNKEDIESLGDDEKAFEEIWNDDDTVSEILEKYPMVAQAWPLKDVYSLYDREGNEAIVTYEDGIFYSIHVAEKFDAGIDFDFSIIVDY